MFGSSQVLLKVFFLTAFKNSSSMIRVPKSVTDVFEYTNSSRSGKILSPLIPFINDSRVRRLLLRSNVLSLSETVECVLANVT